MTPDTMQAAREEGWLRLQAPWSGERDPWELLVRNEARHGPARVVLVPSARDGGLEPMLVIDVPLADPSAAPEPPAPEPEWPRLITGRGWTLAPRRDGRVEVELDTPGCPGVVRVMATGEMVSLSVDIARPGAASPVARAAMACFALVLTGCLRMVRAVAGGDPCVLRLDVRLTSPPSASDLDLALSALSAGYRRASRELRALTDEELATLYLEHLTPAKEITPCDSTAGPAFSCSM